MWQRILRRRIPDPGILFSGPYIDARRLYLVEFDRVCSVAFVNEIEGGPARVFILDRVAAEIQHVHQFFCYDHNRQNMGFVVTIIILSGERRIEIGANYCEILFSAGDMAWANALISEVAHFRVVAEVAPIGFGRQFTEN